MNNQSSLDGLIQLQDALKDAIDARDIHAIEESTACLAEAIELVRQDKPLDRALMDHAIRQTNAIKIRVNILADWTRQRIDLLSEVRGLAPSNTYSKR